VDTGVEFSYILGNRHAAGARIYCTLGIGAEVPLVQAGTFSTQVQVQGLSVSRATGQRPIFTPGKRCKGSGSVLDYRYSLVCNISMKILYSFRQ
jgi:hypothetical protein